VKPSPWAFAPDLPAWLTLVGASVGYAAVVHRPRFAATPRQVRSFAGAIVVLLLALSWPVAELAAHWSLTALVVQRLLLTLAVPPLLLMGLPLTFVAAMTRPAPVDAVIRAVSRPPVAVAMVTVVFVATLTTAAVSAEASSPLARVLLDLALLTAGMVLWLPVLSPVPGTPRLPPLGRAGYLIVQSIVPSFLAVVWILSRHPLYPSFVHPHKLAGLSPLADQQVAGFLAKLGTIAVLWTVAFVIVNRAQPTRGDEEDAAPLTWLDVERHLQRAERRERRSPPGTPPGSPGTRLPP
jgi:cytochrome c oxidase assembly factor CtaG